jgi:hypothetical protein
MVAQTSESHGKMHSLQTDHFLLLCAKNTSEYKGESL